MQFCSIDFAYFEVLLTTAYMAFSPATDFGRIKIVPNPECKIAYTLWSKNISRMFSLQKILVKMDISDGTVLH